MNSQRLSDDELLTRELKSLAAEMNHIEAPASVETKVLEAFRARKVVPITVKRSNSRYWLVAVAAMLLIAISVVAFRWKSDSETPQKALVTTESTDKPKGEPSNPAPNYEPQREPEYQAVNDLPKRHERQPVRPRVRRFEDAQAANRPREIATDFIPLRYMNAASLQDGGQIVRVEVPRSALATFGLPVNMDRYNEKVKADVIVGVDGLAHAIRFVQ